MWVWPKIKDYKLVISDHRTFIATLLLFKTLGISTYFLSKSKSLIING